MHGQAFADGETDPAMLAVDRGRTTSHPQATIAHWAAPFMPLSPGSRLGVFEVISLIGRGGMGEVYRGRDTRLARDVALKMLPDAESSDLRIGF